ncbi:MAG: Kynurenine 3-monooxygenase [Gemmatimonadaceae bacterium]|nr:Kynurenine 3-monooxygenase [Gemmatimonadaceae bacterium]
MTAIRSEVLVVGGGPAGSATACFLARAGVDVLIVDRQRFPRDKPCAEYISPEGSRLLDAMGVLRALESAGGEQLNGMEVHAPGGAVVHGEFVAKHGYRGFRDWGLAIRRTVLDAILLDAARIAGARVMERVSVRKLVRNAGGRVQGALALTADGSAVSLDAPLTVGADGLHSMVGRHADLVRVGSWPRRYAAVAHFRGVQGMSAFGEMYVGAGRVGYAGLAAVGGGVTNVAVVVPAARAEEARGGVGEFVDEWVRALPDLAVRFERAERIDAGAAVGPFNSRARVAWRPGVALVGDAADFFDPFTGEGIYSAMRGGELLAAHALEAVRTPSRTRADAALAAYDRARRREFGPKWRIERLIGTAIECPAVFDWMARRLEADRAMADALIGVTGDFVPPRVVLRPSFLLRLIRPARWQRAPAAGAPIVSTPATRLSSEHRHS